MSGPNDLNLATLAAVIAHSPIVVPRPARPVWPLPAGFEAVDLAILEWIAAEGATPAAASRWSDRQAKLAAG